MRILIDSHSLIWYVDQDHLLSPTAKAAMCNSTNLLLLSAATLWEISIKAGLGKLTLSGQFQSWMNQAVAGLNLSILPITIEYADVQAGLPFHHRDPFDRLLVAQATVEQVPIVSADPVLDSYEIVRIW